MMRKAYSFTTCGKCASTGYAIDALCVFIDTKCVISELDFFDELETSLKQLETLPDCVVIIADATSVDVLHQYWTISNSQRETFQQRGFRNGIPFIKNYYFVAWCPSTGLQVAHKHGESDTERYFDIPLYNFIQQGLHALLEKNPVVQIAPAGHTFKHPSKTVNKLFIQARELATSEAELAFVGRCLTQELKSLSSSKLSTVYIDSMGIYSIVREALAFANSNARIYSFHSYTELSELLPPTEKYVVIISASTTGGMARTLESQGFDQERLLTLIDNSKSDRKGSVLVALDKVDPSYCKLIVDGTETQIELFGEHFSSKAKPPRAVTLGIPHEPKPLRTFLEQFGLNGLLELNTQPTGEHTRRLICADYNVVGGNPQLQSWLKQEIDWCVSVAIDHVIHADDAGSKVLAEVAADILQKTKGSQTRPLIVTYADLADTTLSQATGVLVVNAVAGDGGLLREISRDLREFLSTDVPRHFLVGVGLPQSQETWSRLQQFLVRNPTSRKYGFSAWLVLPIGSEEASNAWSSLSELASKAQLETPHIQGVKPNILDESVNLALRYIENADNGFLPSNQDNALSLSDGFVYFDDVFKLPLREVPVCTTYATIASVLQSAREINDPDNLLKPNVYESVVLSPENFLRFNDNLLQACLLRGAHPSELDYSSSPHLSCLMKEFLVKVFARHAHVLICT